MGHTENEVDLPLEEEKAQIVDTAGHGEVKLVTKNSSSDTLPTLGYCRKELELHGLPKPSFEDKSDTYNSYHHIWVFWLEFSLRLGLILSYLIFFR
jgi:hypothetical protein